MKQQDFWETPIKDMNWKNIPAVDVWIGLVLLWTAVFINFDTAYYLGIGFMILRIICGVLGKILRNQERILKAVEKDTQ